MKIKTLRNRLGMTQAEFAVKLGVAPYTVRRWETEKNKPSPMARKLLDELERELKNGNGD